MAEYAAKYAVAVLVTVEADGPDYAIEKVADMLKGHVVALSFAEAVPLADEEKRGS